MGGQLELRNAGEANGKHKESTHIFRHEVHDHPRQPSVCARALWMAARSLFVLSLKSLVAESAILLESSALPVCI